MLQGAARGSFLPCLGLISDILTLSLLRVSSGLKACILLSQFACAYGVFLCSCSASGDDALVEGGVDDLLGQL